jgi:hypothetical protein
MPLTKSYPVGTFFVTAQNGAPLAPGQPSSLQRILNPQSNLQQSGDPRGTGQFFDIAANSSLQQLITGQSPTLIGGSSTVINNNSASGSQQSGNNLFLWLAGALVLVFFFL